MYSSSFVEIFNSESHKHKMQHQRRLRCRQSMKRQDCEFYTQVVKFSVAIFQLMVAFQTFTSITAQGSIYDNSKFQAQSVVDSDALLSTQSETLDHRGTEHTTSHKLIQFEPTTLNFDEEPIGMPKMSIVYIHNPSKTTDLNLLSIYANTANFHSSFFEKKVVPPGGNTSFEVVFLARIVGKDESTLFISTIQGTFKYQVKGVGIANPYRLRSFIGAKVPLNTSFSPLISMHNPTNQTLQVTEMYSSSGYLQLQLPNNEQHTPDKEFWEIPPYETKCLMRACFLGQVEANHTAFIRIKTNQTEPELHILPVEVEVSSALGIYSSTDLLDFGTLRSSDDPKTLSLFLLNSGKKDVIIQSIKATAENPALEISFRPVKLKPSETVFTKIANVTFIAPYVDSESNWSGKIVIKTQEKKYKPVYIPYSAHVLKGTLGYDHESTLFFTNDKINSETVLRNISLTNTFDFDVTLQSITLPDEVKDYFKVVNFTSPCVLTPDAETVAFSLSYEPAGAVDGENSKAVVTSSSTEVKELLNNSVHFIILHTSASKFSLPLFTYSGKLQHKVLREDADKLDYGIMRVSDSRQILLALYNSNPITVNVTALNCSTKSVSIRMVSLNQGSTNFTIDSTSNVTNFTFPSNSCAVLEVTLNTSTNEQEIISSLNVYTNYQVLRVPVLAQVVIGALILKPAKAKLPPSFPGLVVLQSITVTNTFAQMTKLESVTPRFEDKRFYFKKIKNKVLDLESNKKTKVGKIYFDARQSCKPDKCYVGLPTSTTTGHHWLTTLTLSQEAVELDTKLYKQLKERWQNIVDSNENKPNTSMVLATNVALSVDIPVQAELIWPTLLEEETFHFPLTHIGRNSVAVLTLNNPSDSPVIVQVLPLSYYPQPKAILDMLGWNKMKSIQGLVTKNHSVFNIVSPLNEKDTSMVWLEYTLNGKLNRSAVNLFLNPNQRVTLKVEFMPYDDKPKSTVIVLRNNLTVVDALVVHGTGAHELMKLGGEVPNKPNNMLRIDLNEDILRDCKDPKKSSPNFTVRKSFTAKNMGLLSIQVANVLISNLPCEGYGFRITDCEQFILQPNQTKIINVVFTPDFSSSQIVHKLRIITAQGNEMEFTLKATVPSHMLSICQEAIPRPTWESSVSTIISCIMIGIFGALILNAYLEAINVWEPFVKNYEEKLKLSSRNIDTFEDLRKPFDLREIATNYISTVASAPVESKTLAKNLREGKRNIALNNADVKANNPFQTVYLNLSNTLRSNALAISFMFSKAKRGRRPFKKPLELKTSNPLLMTSPIEQHKAGGVLNNTKHRTVSKELSSGDRNSHSMHPRRRNTTSVCLETNKNFMSKHHTIENDTNHVETIPEPIKFDPVLIAKESALSRGRKAKRESSSSCGSSDVSVHSLDYSKKEDRKNKTNHNKADKFSLFQSSKEDDSLSTTTEDFDNFPNAKVTEVQPKQENRKYNDKTRSSRNSPAETKDKKSIKNLPITTQKNYKKEKSYELSKSRPFRNKLHSDSTIAYGTKRSSKSSSASCSSTEDSPNWELPSLSTPLFAHDHDESMKILSAQSFKAESDIHKERNLSSPSKSNLSRHSSYSSIVSSSSSDSNNTQQKINKSPAKEEAIKERKASGRQRKLNMRGQYAPKHKSKSQDNFYHAKHGQKQNLLPMSTFSSYFSPPQPMRNQNQSEFKQITASVPQPFYANQNWKQSAGSSTDYTAFGQSSLNITGSLLSSQNNRRNVDWNSSYTGNQNSLYNSPPVQPNRRSSNGYNSNALFQDARNECIPFAPQSTTNQRTSPSNVSPFPSFGNYSPPPMTTGSVLSTHSIWSVSNAVTMDEDRNTDESIPVELKSIWSNGVSKS